MWFLCALLWIANPTVVPPLSVRIAFGVWHKCNEMAWDCVGSILCPHVVLSYNEDLIFTWCVQKKTPNLWALANRLASDLHSASHSSKALETQACRNPSFKKYNWRWRGFCLKHKWLNKWWKSNKKNSKKSWEKKGIFSYLNKSFH